MTSSIFSLSLSLSPFSFSRYAGGLKRYQGARVQIDGFINAAAFFLTLGFVPFPFPSERFSYSNQFLWRRLIHRASNWPVFSPCNLNRSFEFRSKGPCHRRESEFYDGTTIGFNYCGGRMAVAYSNDIGVCLALSIIRDVDQQSISRRTRRKERERSGYVNNKTD